MRRARTRKKNMGRPSKYTPAVAKRIFKHVAEGCSREAAAALAGITPATLYDWQNKIPEFLEGLQKADAKFERAAIRSICKAGQRPRYWTANAWALERKLPQRYGRVDRHVIQSTGTGVAPPQAYIDAIRTALGVSGPFIPLHKGQPVQPGTDGGGEAVAAPKKGVSLLPESAESSNEAKQHNGAIVDSEEELPILP